MRKKLFSISKNEILIVNYSEFFTIVNDIDDGSPVYMDKSGVFHGRNTGANTDNESGVSTPSNPEIEDPGVQPDTDPTPDASGKLYSFGAVADIHYDGDGDDEAYTQSDFKKAIALFNKEADFVCAAGDVGRDGRPEDYKALKKALATLNVDFHACRGNHDNYESTSKANYKDATGLSDDYVMQFGGDVFIFLSMKDKNFQYGGLNTAKVDWLAEQFETYKDKRKFLFFHVFIPDTAGNGGGVYKSLMQPSKYAVAKRFVELVKKQSNLIFCNGHSHVVLQSADKYSNANVYHKSGECWHVHIPSCTRPRNIKGVNDLKKGQCYLVDVYTDKVVFRGYDVVEQKFLTKYTYTINLAQ